MSDQNQDQINCLHDRINELELKILRDRVSMRDQFAIAAVQGLMTSQNQEGEWRHCVTEAARISYEVADAMLEARNQGEKT